MPIGMSGSEDQEQQQQPKEAEPDPNGASWNPFTIQREEQHFLDWVRKLTADGHKLSQEEFDRVAKSYHSFGMLARYSISSRAVSSMPWFNAVEHSDYSAYQAVESDGG